jgi:hypothetical protein
MLEEYMLGSIAQVEVAQRFVPDLQSSRSPFWGICPVGQFQLIPEERDPRLRFLPQVIGAPVWDNHVRNELHLVVIAIGNTIKEAANIRVATGLVPNGSRRLDEGAISKGAQESDRVEEVRLPHAVGSGNTGEGPEPNININQIFEAGNLQARQHCCLMEQSKTKPSTNRFSRCSEGNTTSSTSTPFILPFLTGEYKGCQSRSEGARG